MRANRIGMFGLALASAMGILAGNARANGIYAPPVSGNTQFDDWSNSSLLVGANSGFPGFPGSGAWPRGIGSSTGGDAELSKVSGAAYPAGGSIYFGGFSAEPNTLGATLAVTDQTVVSDLKNVVFQIEIGEAWTYDFYNSILPVLNYNGGTQALAATWWDYTLREQTGTVTMPTGEEPVYRNSYILQWDLSSIVGPITDFTISFTGVQHAQLYALRLDQSDVYTSLAPQAAVPEPASMALLGLGALAAGFYARRVRRSA